MKFKLIIFTLLFSGFLILPNLVHAVVIPISDWNDLLDVQNDLNGDYILVNDLDQDTTGYSTIAGSAANGGFGFISISDGFVGLPFNGTFDGDGFAIKDVVIKNQGYAGNGLFFEIGVGAEVFDLNIENISITNTGGEVGALASSNSGTITNVDVILSTIATGNSALVGGLVGENTTTGVITNSTTDVAIDATDMGNAGGLVGENSGTITNSHAYGDLINGNSSGYLGGLVGIAFDTSSISVSSASGNISGEASGAGGLAASMGGTLSNSFASGDVSSTDAFLYIGGLVGALGHGTISDSYATGNVSSDGIGVGGLVGVLAEADSMVIRTFSVGSVEMDLDYGGLIGTINNGLSTISYSFYDTQTSGVGANSCTGTNGTQSDLAGCVGKTTLEMKDIDTFTTDLGMNAWDFDNDWEINPANNDGYPYLSWQVFPDATAPTVDTLSPLDNAVDLVTNTNLVITFSEAVDVESGNITIKKTSDDSTFATIDVTGGLVTGTGTTTITINPATSLSSETEYYVLIDATAFDDIASNSYAGIASTTAWSFTTADEVSPIISETTPVSTPATDTTPSYTFTSDEAGDITYGGSCSSITNTAVIGANTITFDALVLGTYADCTITVTDDALNASNVLGVTPFTIVAPATSSGSSGSTRRVVRVDTTPIIPTTPPTDCLPSYNFSPSTGNPCPKSFIPSCILTQTLKQGSQGEEVKCLQNKLKISTDGIFGPITKQSVINFQNSHPPLAPDGIVGPLTRAVINSSN